MIKMKDEITREYIENRNKLLKQHSEKNSF